MFLDEKKTGIDERKTDIHEVLTGIDERKTDLAKFLTKQLVSVPDIRYA